MSTLLDLAENNHSFRAWIYAHLRAPPAQMMESLRAGDPFRKLLSKVEENRMDEFLLAGGPESAWPAWVKVCNEAPKTQEQRNMETAVKMAAASGMTVMCAHCGCAQTMGTKCFTSGDYHM